MNSRLLFNVSAVIELLTGLALLVAPQLVIGLLLSDRLGSSGIAVARILGVGLVALGLAGWERPGHDIRLMPRAGLAIYNAGAATLLTTLGTHNNINGLLLWPAAILHALIGIAMVLSFLFSLREK